MLVRKLGRSGFTLIEIVFTMTLVVVVFGLSLSALKPGKEKAPTRGLAIALSEEFEAAKQLAIRSGQPVALAIPTTGSLAATSIYRIQGWNVPYITWSKGFSGDYPTTAFAAAGWSGMTDPGALVPVPATAKFFNFDQAALLAWLPDDSESDYVYCFLPDGSLISNGLPSSDGRYTLVVAEKPTFAGSAPGAVTIEAGNSPITIYVSPNGGVETVTGCPGGSIPAGTAAPSSSDAKLRTQAPEGDNVQKIWLSDLIVRPNPTGGTAQEGLCVPGQYVTLEIYAYSPQGVALFANWNHDPGTISNLRGIFTYPQGQGADLTGEADRMEYIPAHLVPSSDPSSPNYSPDAPVWSTAAPPGPGVGVFRAQWSWTVPPVSDAGDLYSVNVNVQNATANAKIENPPPPLIINPQPLMSGTLVVERFSGPPLNIWQLWRMNPDGSGERLLSPQGIQETMASIDRYGNKIAVIQGTGVNRQVKVRFLEGGGEQTVSNPPTGDYSAASISPLGTWVAYRNNATDRIHAKRIGGVEYSAPQAWTGGGHALKKERPGWSWDQRFMLFGNGHALQCMDISNGSVSTFSNGVDTGGGPESCFAPTAFRPNNPDGTPGSVEYVIFSAGNFNPVILGFAAGPCTPGGAGPDYNTITPPGTTVASYPSSPDLDGGGGSLGSDGIDDDFPALSLDSRQLLLTRSPETVGAEDDQNQTVEIFNWDDGANRFIGPRAAVITGNVRRAICIPE